MTECAATGETPPPPADPRTPQDYAIEFGEYLADAAATFLDATNTLQEAQELFADGVIDEQLLNEALEVQSSCWATLKTAVYEFRKRAARAGHEPSAAAIK